MMQKALYKQAKQGISNANVTIKQMAPYLYEG